MEQLDSHGFPFAGSKHYDPISINDDPIILSTRTHNDFDKPDKLILKPVEKSKTGYETYTSLPVHKAQTKGLF